MAKLETMRRVLHDLKDSINLLEKQLVDNQVANSKTTIAAIKVVVDAKKTLIDAVSTDTNTLD